MSATLRLYTESSTINGAQVGAHRLKANWSELNVTYNSANDPNPGNNTAEGALWNMTNPAQLPYEAVPSAVVTQTNGHGGYVEWAVTADVVNAYIGAHPVDNFGWLIKVEDESGNRKADYGSRESTHPPQLLLVVDPLLSNPASLPPTPTPLPGGDGLSGYDIRSTDPLVMARAEADFT